MIVVVNYDSGNIASVLNMVRKAGGDVIASDNALEVENASKLILPGVGAFDHGMRNLVAKGLDAPLKRRAEAGVPTLGICLGMQLLGTASEEGIERGLNLVPARFVRFSQEKNPELRVPHVGWNSVRVVKQNPLIDPGADEQRFYFVHSYHAVCDDQSDVLAETEYGGTFASAFSRNNIYGCQFHPEKSHRFGLSLIKHFVNL